MVEACWRKMFVTAMSYQPRALNTVMCHVNGPTLDVLAGESPFSLGCCSSRLSRPALTQSLKSMTRVDPRPTTLAAMPLLTEPVLRGPLEEDRAALCDGEGAIMPDVDACSCVPSFP